MSRNCNLLIKKLIDGSNTGNIVKIKSLCEILFKHLRREGKTRLRYTCTYQEQWQLLPQY